ncbi:hypothetical protein [Caulobacter sp. 17J80-11]|uniref:hypothetical protein n=1 Tax=Caulobacter sp. 17J80-11 TaxID=2763502 RepID=UPI0016539664|nr:hypothetical protein [Caulobacter sp. 17J80-11]MBC6981741.1 hypothetical protein [Caulobacter sp. 17J80-11]
MGEALRTLLLLALGAGVLTTVGLGAGWWMETGRRLRRALKQSLGGPSDAEVMAVPQGRAAGMRFATGRVAVLWDKSAMGLVYDFVELDGAELIVDEVVVARVRRDEQRKQMDSIPKDAERVTLRLLFSDAQWPEFELDFWSPEIARTAAPGAAKEAVRFGRKWLSHVENVLKRTGGPLAMKPKSAQATAPARPPRERPPWEEDEDEAEAV